MRTSIVVISVLILANCGIYAQRSYTNNRLSIKLGYSENEVGLINKLSAEKTGNYWIEANYGVFNNFDFGIYMGYNRFDAYPKPGTTETGFLSKKYGNTLYYGINTNFHVLPFFIKASDFRFDLYLTTKLGGFSYQTPENYIPEKESFTDFSIGAGTAMYVFKNLGLFCEYTYNTNKINNGMIFRYGLCLKFNFKK